MKITITTKWFISLVCLLCVCLSLISCVSQRQDREFVSVEDPNSKLLKLLIADVDFSGQWRFSAEVTKQKQIKSSDDDVGFMRFDNGFVEFAGRSFSSNYLYANERYYVVITYDIGFYTKSVKDVEITVERLDSSETRWQPELSIDLSDVFAECIETDSIYCVFVRKYETTISSIAIQYPASLGEQFAVNVVGSLIGVVDSRINEKME